MERQIPPQTTLDLFLEIVAELKADFSTANTPVSTIPRDVVVYQVENDIVQVEMTAFETFCLDCELFGPDVALKLLDCCAINDAESNNTAEL